MRDPSQPTAHHYRQKAKEVFQRLKLKARAFTMFMEWQLSEEAE
jgi:hypothetical protein